MKAFATVKAATVAVGESVVKIPAGTRLTVVPARPAKPGLIGLQHETRKGPFRFNVTARMFAILKGTR